VLTISMQPTLLSSTNYINLTEKKKMISRKRLKRRMPKELKKEEIRRRPRRKELREKIVLRLASVKVPVCSLITCKFSRWNVEATKKCLRKR